ncbi:Double-stranded RNA-specific adenosine deaminase [Holothuria leucospilota]|uniref:Double-stranded RNA-specific adenosine deaminase n=1 Tax=Holothuria leucospilota TaxID=206669 RepID=A0A9Q1HJL9_HOLLE|nr:Double-stranded RNA-specific adenosine deaminase [Holothuria leucospilota]
MTSWKGDVSVGSSEDDSSSSGSGFTLPPPPHQNQTVQVGDLEKKILSILDSSQEPVMTKRLLDMVGKKQKKKDVNRSLYRMEKNGLVRKVKEQPPEWIILPNGLGLKYSRSGGQHVSAGSSRGRRGKGRFHPRSGGFSQQGGGKSRMRVSHEEMWNDMMGSNGRGQSGFRAGSKWDDGKKWQPGNQRGEEKIEDIGHRKEKTNPQGISPYLELEEQGRSSPSNVLEPMDTLPPEQDGSSFSGKNPFKSWGAHGFGRGKHTRQEYPPGKVEKGGESDRWSELTDFQETEGKASSPMEAVVTTEENDETTSHSVLPKFPHEVLGKAKRDHHPVVPSLREGMSVPGMGRGMGRMLHSNAPPHGQPPPPLQLLRDASGDNSSSNLEGKLLQRLSTGQPWSTVDLARAVIGKGATSKDVNPTLYKLERMGTIRKTQVQPPMWCAIRTGNVSDSVQGVSSSSVLPFAAPPNEMLNVPPPPPSVSHHQSLPPSFPVFQGSSHSGGFQSLPVPTPSSARGPSSSDVSETMRLLNKNPISAFMEFGQSVQQQPALEMVGQSGPAHKPKFTFIARIGRRTFPPVVSENKKDGRREAAEAALRILAAEGAFQFSSGLSNNSEPGFGGNSFYDQIASLSHQAFNNLVVNIPECFSGKKVIAALILKMDQSDGGRVIALGTGNRCVTGDKLSLEGQTVQDSHAEVVTRRAFMRYLYRQLKMYRSNPEKTILSPSPSGKLALKEGCSLHLYISTAPCGDGAQFSWTDNQGNQEGPSGDLDFSGHANHCPTIEKNIQGLLRTKMELGEGTIPIQEKNPVQTWDAIMQNQQRLRTMSCSDKVCRWNILGLQGSLLSHFVEPIYLSSLTLGTLYHHGHLSRAVCCRLTHCMKSLEEGSDGLPPGYRINHPQLGRVTSPEPPRGTEKTKEFSVNWYAGCDNAEVTDGTVGRIKGVVPSRLCKMNLLKEFVEVCTLYNSPVLQRELDTYNNIKLTAEDFQKAKAFMKHLFRKGKYGTWVEKPVEVEMFPP